MMYKRHVNLWYFFFFKQKTAYEMRISDWSSDVCSSDLANRLRAVAARAGRGSHAIVGRLAGDEFTIFLPDIGSTAEAARVGRAVLFPLGEPFEIAGQEIEIGGTVGVGRRRRSGRGPGRERGCQYD